MVLIVKKVIKYLKNPKLIIIYLMNKNFFFFLSDKLFLKWKFKILMGYKLDLNNPQTFNEKLQWLKLYDRKPTYTKMVDKYESEAWFNYSYKMGEQKFEVEKLNLRSTIGFDTENSVKEELQINGADAAYYRTADNWGTVIFNNGEYIYYIGGNISKEELVKIAQNVE